VSAIRARHGSQSETEREQDKRPAGEDDQIETGKRQRTVSSPAAANSTLDATGLTRAGRWLLCQRDRRPDERRTNNGQECFQSPHG
jgi:hypothetical protein